MLNYLKKKHSKKFDSFVLRPIIMFLRFWKHFYREKIWKFLKTILLTWNWYVYTCVLVHVYTLFKCSNVSYSLKFSFKVRLKLGDVWLCKLQLFSSRQHNHFVNTSGQNSYQVVVDDLTPKHLRLAWFCLI